MCNNILPETIDLLPQQTTVMVQNSTGKNILLFKNEKENFHRVKLIMVGDAELTCSQHDISNEKSC
jgi:hypothetical protein